MGGRFHLKLNISKRPIANKYREGKMQRTLKRECKGLEIAKREAVGNSSRVSLWVARVSASVARAADRLQGGSVGGEKLARVFNLWPVPCARLRRKCLHDADEMVLTDPS